ncbi:unnamed protein product [Orchesella dallaii]|uniref:CARD domain-containing protein n=1 Tax=Orchesella dallaii TaxID=48710 RepID=A0ABP1PNZ8_9HEXA
MDRNAKKAVLKNRVKILNLDYFDLTAPLLASEIFPSKKHKEIKTSAMDSKARVDLLLEWLEESAPKEAFPIFLQGIRNCKELILAKKIKREASGTGLASGSASISNIPLDKLLADIVPGLPSTVTKPPAEKVKKPKAPKLKLPKIIPPTGGPPPPPINGLPSTNLPPPPVPKAKKRKADDAGAKASPGGAKVATKTAKKVNGTPKTERAAGSRSATPKGTPASAAASAAAAAAAAAAAIIGTPRATRKSSSSDTVQAKTDGKGKRAPAKKGKQEKEGTSAAAATSPKGKSPKVATKAMTFKEVEDKQQDFKTKFKFTNDNAVARSILFKDKSDITYLGCPFTASNKMCGKKVELKSKEFICEAKHKSPNCRQIPRLQVTCNDGTADLVLTLMKQNVEVFTGKTENDIETMSVDEIKTVLEKAVGKKLNVEVASEKAKKVN